MCWALVRPSDSVAALTFVVTFVVKPLYNMRHMLRHVLCLFCYTADMQTKDVSNFCNSHADSIPHLNVDLPWPAAIVSNASMRRY